MSGTTVTSDEPIRRAMRRLLTGEHAWYASLALRLRLEPDVPGVDTLATDGVRLAYSRAFFNSLARSVQETAVAHEVLHCAFLHFDSSRRGTRDAALWNAAGDYVINGKLVAAGFAPIPGWLYDPRFNGLSTEQVYAILKKEGKDGGGKQGSGRCVHDAPANPSKGKGKGTPAPGQVDPNAPVEPGTGPSVADLAREWTSAVKEADLAHKAAGTGSDGASRAAAAEREAREDWRTALARYLSKPGDVAWSKPNRRYIGRGLYLPGPVVDTLRCFRLAVDTSGSIDRAALDVLASETEAMLQAAGWPSDARAIYCDDRVHGTQEIAPGEPLRPLGGGGTRFAPVFDHVQAEGIEPDVLIYFTDLDSYDLGSIADPGYPVLWVCPRPPYHDRRPSFGDLVIMADE